MQRIELPEPRRVLIVKPSAIGDVVHGLPVLALLKRRWPDAAFSWLVTPACAGILQGHPLLDEVIQFDRKGLGKSWYTPAGIKALVGFSRGLAERKFDVAIDLQGLFRSGWLTWQTRAPVRIGLSDAREFATTFYTHRVKVGTKEQHAIERYLAVPEALGAGRGPVEFPLAYTSADVEAVRALTPPRYVALFPGTNWPTKRWPVEKFAALADLLQQKYGLPSVVGGGPTEAELGPQIPNAINLAGKTTLNQLAALIAGADVVVSNDSGPMHIAVALNKPLAAPFGPTNPIRTGPHRRLLSVVKLDLPCSPCYSRKCSHQSCLQALNVEEVLRVVECELNR